MEYTFLIQKSSTTCVITNCKKKNFYINVSNIQNGVRDLKTHLVSREPFSYKAGWVPYMVCGQRNNSVHFDTVYFSQGVWTTNAAAGFHSQIFAEELRTQLLNWGSHITWVQTIYLRGLSYDCTANTLTPKAYSRCSLRLVTIGIVILSHICDICGYRNHSLKKYVHTFVKKRLVIYKCRK